MRILSTVLATLVLVSTASFAQSITVKNPNNPQGGSTRDAQVVAAEKKLAVEALAAIDRMAKTEGIAKASAEINKGRAGAFGKLMPQGHFYLSVCEFKTPTSAVFVAHGTNPAFVGFEVPSLEIFKDNTGWNYAEALFQKAGSATNFDGVIEGILWTDPEWQKGKKAQMVAFNKVATYGQKKYWLYYAVWTEQ